METQKKTALIIGMARSGIASAKLLHQNGYRVIINDMKSSVEGLFEALDGIDYIDALGKDPMELLSGVDLLVLSPVVPIFAPFAKEAIARGIEVIGEIELGYRFASRKTRFVCVSGTNGKTTTTAWTGEVFKAAGKPTYVLGNIGIPITEYSMRLKDGDYVVAEVAALQLESIKDFRANAIGMLNITEDHLNRFEYKMENYVAAKCRVFENQLESDFAVLNYDDETVRAMSALTKARVVYFSTERELEEGMFLRNGVMVFRWGGVETQLIHVSELKIPGAHNVQNALCSAALGLCMGLDKEGVCAGLKAFTGWEHRTEFVRELDGVAYINDSKATNPDSTIKAVEAMTRPTVLLLGVGNYDKKSNFTPLFEAFHGRIKAVIASGVCVNAIMEAARETGFENIATCTGALEDMLLSAKALSEPGDAVLLSPAAASWGIYADFEERGRMFKEAVMRL